MNLEESIKQTLTKAIDEIDEETLNESRIYGITIGNTHAVDASDVKRALSKVKRNYFRRLNIKDVMYNKKQNTVMITFEDGVTAREMSEIDKLIRYIESNTGAGQGDPRDEVPQADKYGKGQHPYTPPQLVSQPIYDPDGSLRYQAYSGYISENSEVTEAREYQLQAYKEDGAMEVSNWHSKEDFILDLKKKVDKDESYESTMIMKRIAEMEYEEEDELKPTLEKKYGMETKKESIELDEKKMTPAQRKSLDKLINDFQSATDPSSMDDEEDPDKIIDRIRKQFGKKIADQVEDGEYTYHYGRKYQKPYMGTMGKYGNAPRTTKKGGLNKQDINPAKKRSKQGRQYTQKLNPNLPEAYDESVELDEANKYSSDYDKLIKRAAKLPWDKKPKVRKSKGNVEYFGEVDRYKVEFAVQDLGPASYFAGLNLAPPGRFTFTYLFKDSGDKILDTVYADGVSDKDQKANIDDFEKALDMIETGAFKKEVKESADSLEGIMSMKERTNDDTYAWQQINKAMMNAGYGATQILKLVKALKGKQINKGDMGNNDAYYWADINQALMKGVGLSPSAIFKVLQQLNKLAESTKFVENNHDIPDEYEDFMKDQPGSGESWIVVKASNYGEDKVSGEIAKKNWPSGAPVTKTFTKGIAQIPDGEFWVIVARRYWYWMQDNGKWAALSRKNSTPPFDY